MFTSKKAISDRENVSVSHSFFTPVQAKLYINAPNDIYEKEADAVAEQVVQPKQNLNASFFKGLNISSIQRKCAHCEEEEKTAQRKEQNTVSADTPNSVEQYVSGLSGSGNTMPQSTQQFFSSRMGYDFSNVKIHNDNIAAKSAQSINALAYTSSNNIVFNQGQYQPETESGKKLLAHELTHVLQQGNGNANVQRSLANISTTINVANQQRIRNRISFWDVPLALNVTSSAVLEQYFRSSPPNTSNPFSGTIIIDPSVNQITPAPQNATHDLARGFANLPGHFVRDHNMPANTTATITMDLTSFGGQSGVFRITHLNANPSGTGAAQMQFHIEFVSAIHTTQPQTTRPSSFSIGSQNFTAIGWPNDRYDELIEVMNRIPSSALQKIDGMRFRYRSQVLQTISQLGEDGEAQLQTGVAANRREIIVWSTVTRPTILNYSGFSRTAYVVAHEIGHWLDFDPIFIANGSAAVNSNSGYYRLTAAGDLEENANSRTAFQRLNTRNAAITTYGGTDLKESFAEYFAMYVMDAPQLQLLRPDIFAYFRTNYP